MQTHKKKTTKTNKQTRPKKKKKKKKIYWRFYSFFCGSPFVLQNKTNLNRTIHVQLWAVPIQIFSGNDNFDIIPQSHVAILVVLQLANHIISFEVFVRWLSRIHKSEHWYLVTHTIKHKFRIWTLSFVLF